MPFTPSHAVVALAFTRTPLVPAAIAVGAMAPDLPLFIRRVIPGYAITHDLVWLPATVVMALALLLVWRCVLRPAVRELVPRSLAERIPAEWDRAPSVSFGETFSRRGSAHPTWSGVLVLLLSLAIGVISHIVWDSFTHEGREGVAILPVLDAQWGPLLGFKWLQYGSGVVGLVVIGVWALVRVRSVPPTRIDNSVLPSVVRVVWWISLPLVLVIAWVAGLWALGPLDENFTVAHLGYRVLPPACAVWAALTVVLCLAVVWMRRARHSAGS